MQITEIAQIESKNTNSIHLIQDALFFRAWERSAWLFCEVFQEYKINCRFYKNIQQELLWLGFPRTILSKYVDAANAQGWTVVTLADSHVRIDVPAVSIRSLKQEFSDWRNQKLLKKHSQEKTTQAKVPEAVLVGFRLSYDLALDIYRVSGRLNRDYRFSLGERVRAHSSQIIEQFHLWANSAPLLEHKLQEVYWNFHRVRLDLRMLNGLSQIKETRWLQLNAQLESVRNQLEILQNSLIRESVK